MRDLDLDDTNDRTIHLQASSEMKVTTLLPNLKTIRYIEPDAHTSAENEDCFRAMADYLQSRAELRGTAEPTCNAFEEVQVLIKLEQEEFENKSPEELIRSLGKLRAQGQRMVIDTPNYKGPRKVSPWEGANALPDFMNW
jgi:hypothetical protein